MHAQMFLLQKYNRHFKAKHITVYVTVLMDNVSPRLCKVGNGSKVLPQLQGLLILLGATLAVWNCIGNERIDCVPPIPQPD